MPPWKASSWACAGLMDESLSSVQMASLMLGRLVMAVLVGLLLSVLDLVGLAGPSGLVGLVGLLGLEGLHLGQDSPSASRE